MLLSVLVVLGGGLVAYVGLAGGGSSSDEPFVVPPPTAAAARVDGAGAGVALARLQRAIHQHDRAAAAALAGDDDPATAGLLGDLVTTARAARIDDVTFRYVDEEGGTDADGVWQADVGTTWRFAGFDAAPATAEVTFSFRTTSGGVRIAGVGASTLRTPVWMSGPVQVHRSRDTVVLVAGSAPTMARYVSLAEHAVPVVRRVATTWRPRVVVEVPRDLDGLDRALAEPAGSDSQIAALAASVDGTATPRTPVHILVNPDVFSTLPRLGAQVVMSHELTHLATDAYRSASPTWLKEGIADYTALRDVRLPFSRTAGQIAAQVRADGLPTRLPSATDFDPNATHLGAIYEAAWLVCVTLADRGGQQALVDLYDRTSAGAPLARTLEQLFGWTTRDLVAAWRTRLSHLPGA